MALIDEQFVTASMDITGLDPVGDQAALVKLTFYIGGEQPVALIAKMTHLTPEVAIAVGEALVTEGKRLQEGKSDLTVVTGPGAASVVEQVAARARSVIPKR